MDYPMNQIPTKEDIIKAHERIKGQIHKTPVLTSILLNEIFGAELFFKCENFQKVGAFKFRGASNAILSLPDSEIEKGVCTHSSGNHAAALALAAKMKKVKAYIVMPRTAPQIKHNAVKGYGAEIIFCEPNLKAREEALEKVIEKTGAVFIHPYDNYMVIAGQATASKELIEEVNYLDYIIAPVGGGGLCSGTALSAKYFGEGISVIGAEPLNADDAFHSLKEGSIQPSINPKTIADGLMTQLSEKTFSIIKDNVEKIVTVKEETMIECMKMIWERMKIIIEPSSAVVLAAIAENKEEFKTQKIGLIISGGNVDLNNLPW